MATIDTNMSLVMIDPNEPLELYDGTIIKGRLEWFLYALCCLDYGNLPTPLSRIEEWANALITNELPNMEPQSRAEEFFKAILTGDTSNLPTPQSRSEVLLDKLARGENDFTNVEKIQSRYEFLLAYLIKNGGGIGNIDYVLYKFQKEDETLYNTKERPVKSAILKGQTLVNMVAFKQTNTNASFDSATNVITLADSTGWIRFDETRLKPSTKYIIIIDILECTLGSDSRPLKISLGDGTLNAINVSSEQFKVGRIVATETTPSTILTNYFNAQTRMGSSCKFKLMVIEYQEGMENWDIPYFTGMQSVKMPVLTTIGKNLFDGEYHANKYVDTENGMLRDSSNSHATDFILIRGFESITCSNEGYEAFAFYNENKIFIMGGFGKRLEVPKNAYYVRFTIKPTDNLAKFMVVEGSLLPPYEPYKTNILTTSEDVTLRGIGDIQDTLDCLMGEVTQAIYEYTFTGDEDWRISGGGSGGYTYFSFGASQLPIRYSYSSDTNIPIMSDRLPLITYRDLDDGLKSVGINLSYFFRLNFSDCDSNNGATVEDLKAYLKANPTTVQYPISKSVKTVDLTITDQGGATIPKLNTFDKITHVNVSATDILPEVEMEVATTVGEDLSGTLYSIMEDIETKQEVLKESNNAQTESVNSTMMATTEIYESLL